MDRSSQMQNKQIQSKKVKTTVIISSMTFLFSFFIFMYFILTYTGCTDMWSAISNSKNVFLVLEKNNSQYLYYKLNRDKLYYTLEKGEHPSESFTSVAMFIGKEALYVSPSDLATIVRVLSGNYELIDYDTGNISGFFIDNNEKSFLNVKHKNIATGQIGQTASITKIEIIHPMDSNRTLLIEYQTKPELKAIQNVELKNVNVRSNPYPGKTVISARGMILVDLQVIIDFLNPSAQLVYVKDKSMVKLVSPN